MKKGKLMLRGLYLINSTHTHKELIKSSETQIKVNLKGK